jgi:hypothetical protein
MRNDPDILPAHNQHSVGVTFDESYNCARFKLWQRHEAFAESKFDGVSSPGVWQEHIDWAVRLHAVVKQPKRIEFTDKHRPRALRVRGNEL